MYFYRDMIMSDFIVSSIKLRDSGKGVLYSYEVSDSIKKFFKEPFFIDYDVSVEGVPDSILIIPLLANVLPISWLVGFNITVDSLDEQFYQAVLEIKKVFIEEFPEISNKQSNIIFSQLERNHTEIKKDAMLFSSGVDAYASYFNHQQDDLDLILIKGADIPLEDTKQWETAKSNVNDEVLLRRNQKHYIAMNCRDFYSYRVKELISGGGWWGKVQHGLTLTCAVAPLAHKLGYGTVYIAATDTPDFKVFWGSMPEIDNNVKWANTHVVHDCYHMHRTEKVESIVKNTKQLNKKINLRVCYSEFNNGLNCNQCEKCYRTIFALTLFGCNPNDFGFNVDKNLYKDIEKKWEGGFVSEGIRYDWEPMLALLKTNNLYQFAGYEHSTQQLEDKLRSALLSKIVHEDSKTAKSKRIIIATFPKAFKKYLKIRGLFR